MRPGPSHYRLVWRFEWGRELPRSTGVVFCLTASGRQRGDTVGLGAVRHIVQVDLDGVAHAGPHEGPGTFRLKVQ